MEHKELLIKRLDEIGTSLAQTGNALALLSLGSVGVEVDRLDNYSDLDFFAIVKPGFKQAFIQNLDWLESIAPVAFAFLNTHDGYKLLYADGVFCEFAVFEPDELAQAHFSPGRIIWKDASFNETDIHPPRPDKEKKLDIEWQLGEALTNLYVGMGRYRRGEKLSAARFIQGFAVDRVLELAAAVETEAPVYRDQYMNERRFEKRFPVTTEHLAEFVQGYERTPESARAILDFLDQHFKVNPHLKNAILELCAPPT